MSVRFTCLSRQNNIWEREEVTSLANSWELNSQKIVRRATFTAHQNWMQHRIKSLIIIKTFFWDCWKERSGGLPPLNHCNNTWNKRRFCSLCNDIIEGIMQLLIEFYNANTTLRDEVSTLKPKYHPVKTLRTSVTIKFGDHQKMSYFNFSRQKWSTRRSQNWKTETFLRYFHTMWG